MALRRAREAQRYSRARLASLSGLSESCIRNIELGLHQPSEATILSLCRVLDLPTPIPGEELRLPLGWLDLASALPVLCQALREHIDRRANPEAFADRQRAQGVDRDLAVYEAMTDRETANHLLKLLTAKGSDMTDRAPKTRRGRWRGRREHALLTQEELATRAGLSLKKLKAIEAGQEEPTPKERSALNAVIDDGPAQR